MQLKHYRHDRALTLTDIARMMRKSVATIHRHENGTRIPDLDEIEEYRKVTGGAVTVEDWDRLAARTRKARAAA